MEKMEDKLLDLVDYLKSLRFDWADRRVTATGYEKEKVWKDVEEVWITDPEGLVGVKVRPSRTPSGEFSPISFSVDPSGEVSARLISRYIPGTKRRKKVVEIYGL